VVWWRQRFGRWLTDSALVIPDMHLELPCSGCSALSSTGQWDASQLATAPAPPPAAWMRHIQVARTRTPPSPDAVHSPAAGLLPRLQRTWLGSPPSTDFKFMLSPRLNSCILASTAWPRCRLLRAVTACRLLSAVKAWDVRWRAQSQICRNVPDHLINFFGNV